MLGCVSAAGCCGVAFHRWYHEVTGVLKVRALGHRELLQHDKDSKLKPSKATGSFLGKNRAKVIQWPARHVTRSQPMLSYSSARNPDAQGCLALMCHLVDVAFNLPDVHNDGILSETML